MTREPEKLEFCGDGRLPSTGIDYWITARTYNLCFWLSSEKSYLFLPIEPTTIVALYPNGYYEAYSTTCISEIEHYLHKVIGLSEDVSGFHEIALRDPLLSEFVSTYPGWRLRSTSTWWALVTGICQQNASFKQGWGMLHNIVLNYGYRVSIGGEVIPRPPQPREVLADPSPLIESRVGYRAKTILNVAKYFTSGGYEIDISSMKPVEVERELRRIKGVGQYTARLAIALSQRRYELPPIDRWLSKIIGFVYGVDEKYSEEYWVEKWGSWSALASIAVTIALDAEPLSKALERIRYGKLTPDPGLKQSPLNMYGFCNSSINH